MLLGNDAVMLEGTVLYADMADSTALVDGFKDWFAAEVYKSYLVAASHIIRKNSGEITAFDGDRVMAVYVGGTKNTSAAKTALQLNWAVNEINAALKSIYPNSAFQLKHSVGIDTSNLFVAKTGIRNSNDLVWVGRAANYAAKLCAVTESVATITDRSCGRAV
jgi:class 3 adenylate cyclase